MCDIIQAMFKVFDESLHGNENFYVDLVRMLCTVESILLAFRKFNKE